MTVYASGSKKLPPPQHVVFADLVLPRLTGTRAAEHVRFRVSHLIGADLRLSYDA